MSFSLNRIFHNHSSYNIEYKLLIINVEINNTILLPLGRISNSLVVKVHFGATRVGGGTPPWGDPTLDGAHPLVVAPSHKVPLSSSPTQVPLA